MIQTLEDLDINCIMAISPNILAIGHTSYAKISIWKWNGSVYEKFQKRPLNKGGMYNETPINKMIPDPYSKEPNQIYCVLGT